MLLFTLALGILLVTAFLLHCDDLFLDTYTFLKRIRPQALSPLAVRRLTLQPQRRIALLIPNWREPEHLQKMVSGNLHALHYENYSVFLGVYPNDFTSWEAARRLEASFPRVSVIVNDKNGPTSKAQLLNEMVRQILASEEISGLRHEAFLLHDAEDVIHPLSLCLLNQELETADLVQLPVLSLPVSWKHLTAGTYADESAESHTKDFLARHALGARLPNPGVGTAVSRTLLGSLLNQGFFLNEKRAAENYHLGLRAGKLGFASRFVSAYRGERDFIATRKFFPDRTASAIRQKARWTTGVAFQGASRFGESLADRYFLWRDRRGPWTTLFLALASGLFLVSAFQTAGEPPLLPRWLEVLSLANATLWVRRAAWRMRTTAWVHGWAYALLVPLRWPVANFINSLSTWRALALYRESLHTGEAPAAALRARRLPENFRDVPARPALGGSDRRARHS